MKTNFTRTLATIFTTTFMLILSGAIFANNGGDKNSSDNAKKEAAKNLLNYTIHFDNSANKIKAVDSALVILDKYDHTGAGVVISVFYTNENDQLVLSGIPEGKYYAEVYTYGAGKQHFSTVIKVGGVEEKKKLFGKKTNKATILKLDYVDTFTPGNAEIPAEDISQFGFARK